MTDERANVGRPRREYGPDGREQAQHSQFGRDAGGHDGNSLPERGGMPLRPVALFTDQIGEARQQEDDEDQQAAQGGRHRNTFHCGDAVLKGYSAKELARNFDGFSGPVFQTLAICSKRVE